MLDQKGMKQRRRLRIVSQLTQVLSKLLRERDLLTTPDGAFVVISRIEMTDDFAHARVFCSGYGDQAEQVIKHLQQQAKTIRTWLTAKHLFRYCPVLTFCQDDQQNKVLNLLASLEKS